jgi:4-hydroxybenzoate polyprenyltransferase
VSAIAEERAIVASPATAAQASLPRRLYAWMEERFPVANGLLAGVVYASALLLGRHAAGARTTLALGDLGGYAAAFCFFLMLRVFDEHKDFANDCRLYPERVLSRGLVTLRHLKVLGAVAIAVQLAVSLAHGGGATLRWLAVMGWSLLMLREFFVPRWLSRHLVVYAVSHMLVTPLAVLWMAQLGAGDAPLDRAVWAYAVMSLLFGFCFELVRKMKAPSEERDDVTTYTSLYGVFPVTLAIAILWSASTAALAAVLVLAGVPAGSPWLWAGLAALALPAPIALERMAHAPTPAAGKGAQAIVGLSLLVANLALATVLLARGGWS